MNTKKKGNLAFVLATLGIRLMSWRRSETWICCLYTSVLVKRAYSCKRWKSDISFPEQLKSSYLYLWLSCVNIYFWCFHGSVVKMQDLFNKVSIAISLHLVTDMVLMFFPYKFLFNSVIVKLQLLIGDKSPNVRGLFLKAFGYCWLGVM